MYVQGMIILGPDLLIAKYSLGLESLLTPVQAVSLGRRVIGSTPNKTLATISLQKGVFQR
jgi:hypothetical protein